MDAATAPSSDRVARVARRDEVVAALGKVLPSAHSKQLHQRSANQISLRRMNHGVVGAF